MASQAPELVFCFVLCPTSHIHICHWNSPQDTAGACGTPRKCRSCAPRSSRRPHRLSFNFHSSLLRAIAQLNGTALTTWYSWRMREAIKVLYLCATKKAPSRPLHVLFKQNALCKGSPSHLRIQLAHARSHEGAVAVRHEAGAVQAIDLQHARQRVRERVHRLQSNRDSIKTREQGPASRPGALSFSTPASANASAPTYCSAPQGLLCNSPKLLKAPFRPLISSTPARGARPGSSFCPVSLVALF